MDLSRAIILATQAHENQVDKSGAPYILHPLRVMLAVPESLRVAAVLHDVVEDTPVDLTTIRRCFGAEIAETVDALSRRSGEVYMEFIGRLAQHSGARTIKRADIADNLGRLTPELSGMERRYAKALALLDSVEPCL